MLFGRAWWFGAFSVQCMCIHTYIHTYVRTYVRTYIHTYIHTYMRTYVHTYERSRYAPWWLNVEVGRTQVGFAGANCAIVPPDVFDALHPKAKPLYAHRVPGRYRGSSMQKVLLRTIRVWNMYAEYENNHLNHRCTCILALRAGTRVN